MRSSLCGGLCVAAVVAGLVFAGCGGDDDPSKAEFVKDANAICRDGDKKIDVAADEAFTGNERPSDAEITKFAEDTAIPTIQSEIDDIRDLGAPSGDEGRVSAILDEAQAALDKAKADPLILAAENDGFDKANRLAAGYGLSDCAG